MGTVNAFCAVMYIAPFHFKAFMLGLKVYYWLFLVSAYLSEKDQTRIFHKSLLSPSGRFLLKLPNLSVTHVQQLALKKEKKTSGCEFSES